MVRLFSRCFIVVFFFSTVAHSIIVIDIFKQNDNALNIALVKFTNDTNNLTAIIANDLKNSGKFKPQFVTNSQTKNTSFEAIIYGEVTQTTKGYEIAVYLRDIWTNNILFSRKISTATLSRELAHFISDQIYFALLGERSTFATKLAYVEVNEDSFNKYSLVITDSDGENKQVLFTSPFPILAPAFSPDNAFIAYTAFSKNRSQVFVQNIYDSKELYTLPNFDGIASSPAWHPSGKKLAITLSKEGNSDIYEYNLDSGSLKRITSHQAVDTEASYSPDGNTIIWTSNRSGLAQIWQKKSNTISKINIPGNYNTSASFSPDGAYLVLVHLDYGSFKTALYSLKDNELILLSHNKENESPHFAPNSKAVIFSNYDGGMRIIDIDGSHSITLRDKYKIIEPTWSNF